MKTESVVILFEDKPTREKAVKFCDQLVQRHWTRCEFRLTWLDFLALGDANAARDAAAKIRGADIVVFAARAEGRLPLIVTEWVEGWLANRKDHEGMLAGLIDGGPLATGWAADKHSWLRSVAHRAGMDYLTEVPQEITRPIPDSLESFSERAELVTSVLDEILHRPSLPRQMP
jgi:ornithine cyclodeaminase/alanine dehydrogenase-like protein (mu-crystallin family)